MNKIIVILIIVTTSFIIYPQKLIDSTKVSIKKSIELENLQQRNNDLIEFQNKLIDTIHWSLGFAATFLILFLGINIYFQRNRYNEDKERFLKQIEDAIKVKSFELEKSIQPIIDTSIENKTASFNNSIKSLKQYFNDLKIETNDYYLDILKLQNAPKDTIMRYYFIQAQDIKAANNYWKWGWKLSDCFDKMGELLDKGAKFDSMDYPDITQFIDSLPKEYSDIVHKFRTKFRNTNV